MKTKQERQREALARQEEHNSLTVKQKITKINLRLGEGAGAVKERAKLRTRLLVETVNEQKSTAVANKEPKKKYQKPKKS